MFSVNVLENSLVSFWGEATCDINCVSAKKKVDFWGQFDIKLCWNSWNSIPQTFDLNHPMFWIWKKNHT